MTRRQVTRWAGGVATLASGAALTISGYTNRHLAYALGALTLVSLAIVLWPDVIFLRVRSPLYVAKDDRSAESRIASAAPGIHAAAKAYQQESLHALRVALRETERDRDQWKQKAIDAEQQRDVAVQQGKLQTGRAESLNTELSVMRSELNTVKSANEHNSWLVRYGGVYPEAMPKLDSGTLESIRPRLSELAPALNDMYNEAEMMWLLVGADASASGEGSATFWLHYYIHNVEYQFARRIGQRFWEALESKDDLRPVLASVCINYFEWREKTLLLAALTGIAATKRPNYSRWREAERRFFEDLQRKVAIPEVDPIRKQIREYFAQHGVTIRVDLPPGQLVLPPAT